MLHVKYVNNKLGITYVDCDQPLNEYKVGKFLI